MSRSIGVVNDYIEQGSAPIPRTGSLSFWAFCTWSQNDGAQHVLFAVTGGGVQVDFDIQKYSNNNIYAGWNYLGSVDHRVIVPSSGYTLLDGWNHFVLTWTDGGNTSLYLNGALIGTAAGLTTVDTTGVVRTIGRFSIGFSPPSASSGWAGYIAEYALWNAVLTPAEVTTLYGSGTAPVEPNTVQTAALTDYLPIRGTATPEPNLVTGGAVGVVTGTIRAADPPTVAPVPPLVRRWTSADTPPEVVTFTSTDGGVTWNITGVTP